jgi:hypothetical protein
MIDELLFNIKLSLVICVQTKKTCEVLDCVFEVFALLVYGLLSD